MIDDFKAVAGLAADECFEISQVMSPSAWIGTQK